MVLGLRTLVKGVKGGARVATGAVKAVARAAAATAGAVVHVAKARRCWCPWLVGILPPSSALWAQRP